MPNGLIPWGGEWPPEAGPGKIVLKFKSSDADNRIKVSGHSMSEKSGPQFPSTLYRYNDEVNSINHLNDLWRSFYQSVQLTRRSAQPEFPIVPWGRRDIRHIGMRPVRS